MVNTKKAENYGLLVTLPARLMRLSWQGCMNLSLPRKT